MSPFLLDDSAEEMDESSVHDHPGNQKLLYIFFYDNLYIFNICCIFSGGNNLDYMTFMGT